MSYFKSAVAAAIALGAVSVASHSASAATILVFGQSGTGQTVTGTNNGNGTTTISAQNVAIIITAYAGIVNPIVGFLDLLTTTTTPATAAGGVIEQFSSGTFSITSSAAAGGTNYLSGTFNDKIQFTSSGGGLSASTPPMGAVTFTADPAWLPTALLSDPRALAFSFTNISPPASLCGPGPTLCSFTASIGGNFSANAAAIPEPATLSLLGVGLLGLGFVRRRKSAGETETAA